MNTKLKNKIERQNRNTNKKMTMYILGMKSTTRISFSRNALWNNLNSTKEYYAHTRLQD
jgi:hypothetical protein